MLMDVNGPYKHYKPTNITRGASPCTSDVIGTRMSYPDCILAHLGTVVMDVMV